MIEAEKRYVCPACKRELELTPRTSRDAVTGEKKHAGFFYRCPHHGNDFTVSPADGRAYGQIAYDRGLAGRVMPDASRALEDESIAADMIHDKLHRVIDYIRSGRLDLNDPKIPLGRIMDMARNIEKRLRVGEDIPEDVQNAVQAAIRARLP